MSTRITILLGAWFMVITASAQPNALWEREYGIGDVRVEGSAIASTNDGGFLIAGTYTPGGWISQDILLIRINGDGDTLWTRIIDFWGAEFGGAMVRTSDGNYVIRYGSSSFLKIDADGDTLWTWAAYTDTHSETNFEGVNSIIASENGGILVVGSVLCSPYGWYTYIAQVDSDGVREWSDVHFRDLYWIPTAIARTPGGNYLIAGFRGGVEPRLNVAGMDSDGNIEWTHEHSIHLYPWCEESIDVLPLDDGYAVCYALDTTAIFNSLMVDRMNGSGQVLWHQTLDSFLVGTYCKLLESPDGEILLAGTKYQGEIDWGFGLVALSESGELHWHQTFGDGNSEGFSGAILTENNNIAMVGGVEIPNVGIRIYAVRTTSLLEAPEIPPFAAISLYLHPCYPNPFNPTTTITFDLPISSPVSLIVYNLTGQKVQTLVDDKLSAGSHLITFDGSRFSSGVYFYTLTAGSYTATNKMLLLK